MPVQVLPSSASGSDQLSESVISEGNIMAFMALLEHRVTELVQMVHASKVGYSLTHASPGNAALDARSSDAQRLLSKVLASSVTIGTSKSSVAAMPTRLPSIGDSDSDDGMRSEVCAPLYALCDVLRAPCAESIVFGVGPAAFRASSVRPVSLEHLKFTASKALERRKAKLAAEFEHLKHKY